MLFRSLDPVLDAAGREPAKADPWSDPNYVLGGGAYATRESPFSGHEFLANANDQFNAAEKQRVARNRLWSPTPLDPGTQPQPGPVELNAPAYAGVNLTGGRRSAYGSGSRTSDLGGQGAARMLAELQNYRAALIRQYAGGGRF